MHLVMMIFQTISQIRGWTQCLLNLYASPSHHCSVNLSTFTSRSFSVMVKV